MFNKNKSSFESSLFDSLFIEGVFAFIVVSFIATSAFYIFVGTKVYDEVQSNGSIAKTLGSFYKEFKEASKVKDKICIVYIVRKKLTGLKVF